jgi:hypothetical protein
MTHVWCPLDSMGSPFASMHPSRAAGTLRFAPSRSFIE